MKNVILKTITGCAATLSFLCGFGVDSLRTAGVIIFALSFAWLIYFCWCNGWYDKGGAEYVHKR